MKRRLAAILAADVAGYTRLMGADETSTLRRLTELRTQVLEPLIADHAIIFGDIGVAFADPVLHLHGALHGFHGAGKLCEETEAGTRAL